MRFILGIAEFRTDVLHIELAWQQPLELAFIPDGLMALLQTSHCFRAGSLYLAGQFQPISALAAQRCAA